MKKQHTVLQWIITIIILLFVFLIGGLRVPGQTLVVPYPQTIPIPQIGPGAGIVGGLIYAVSQAPQHTYPDERKWTQDQGNHRTQIRSWTLHLYTDPRSPIPYMSKNGFCSYGAAIVHARRYHPNLYSTVVPSPLPAWRPQGAWDLP